MPDPDLLLDNNDEDLSMAAMFFAMNEGTENDMVLEYHPVPAPTKPKGSIGLGSLLVAPQPEQHLTSAPMLHIPPPSTQAPPRALTVQELEAQLMGIAPSPVHPPPVPQHFLHHAIPPPHPMIRPGVYTPEMIAAGVAPAPQPPPPAWGAHHPRPHGPPPAALGASAPRPSQRVCPPPPEHQQGAVHSYANLAQRLKALNLAEPDEEGLQQAVQQYRTPNLQGRRGRTFGSRYMKSDEIENILQMQWRSLHQGVPYSEDYYYQAFVHKYYGGKNQKLFAPESVRELAPTEKVAADEISFVKLEGLGKVPFSNIRRPRPLMDVTAEELKKQIEGKEGEEGMMAHRTVRPLGQEPLLAARIMIEDCMCLILDVLDVDAIFAAGGAQFENADALRTRRSLLLNGLTVSMRLPESATGGSGIADGLSDGVFLRLATLPKGRSLIARSIRVIYPPKEALEAVNNTAPNLRVLWAVLRNCRALFSCAKLEDAVMTAKVAEAAVDVIKHLKSEDAFLSACEALETGDLYVDSMALEAKPEAVLLPLSPRPSNLEGFPWLSDMLVAICRKSADLDLVSHPAWRQSFSRVKTVVVRHISALCEALNAAQELNDATSIQDVKGMAPVELIKAMLSVAEEQDKNQLHEFLERLVEV